MKIYFLSEKIIDIIVSLLVSWYIPNQKRIINKIEKGSIICKTQLQLVSILLQILSTRTIIYNRTQLHIQYICQNICLSS